MRNLAVENAEVKMRVTHPAFPYVAPFAVFMLFLAFKSYFPAEYPIRVLAVAAVMIFFSRGAVSLRASRPIISSVVGVLVFILWIGPDHLWPAYRQHWLFHNFLMGGPHSSLPPQARTDPWFLLSRIIGTALIVPIIEELFWRGWLMRFLVSSNFLAVRLGTYTAFSFWITAVLFASEHGPYWEVGLLAGIAYNAWMIRTRSLGDCILAHAVTNSCLAVYVLAAGQWQYWL